MSADFWSGAGGSIIGTLGSALVALVAIRRTHVNERKLMRETMSVNAASDCLAVANAFRRRVDKLRWASPDFNAARSLAEDSVDFGERVSHLSMLVRPRRLHNELSDVWESFTDTYARGLRSAAGMKHRELLESVLIDMGQHLTNVMDELDLYLRADLDRDRWRQLRVWDRYRPAPKWPFYRRVTITEVLDSVSRQGPPKRDY